MIEGKDSFYGAGDPERHGRCALPKDAEALQALIATNLTDPATDRIVELGSGRGALKDCHQNYLGIDISHYALSEFLPGKGRVQADVESLPLKSNTVALLFTIATLEHIPHPERSLAEIDRVLRPGGIAYLFPAWFCRPWASKGLAVKSFAELSMWDRLVKATIPVRDSLIFRSAYILPLRIFRELRYTIWGRPLAFTYRRLTPNLEEYMTSDSDAYASMDPHTVIMYYRSRGYEILGARSLKQRLLVRHVPVVVRKLSC